MDEALLNSKQLPLYVLQLVGNPYGATFCCGQRRKNDKNQKMLQQLFRVLSFDATWPQKQTLKHGRGMTYCKIDVTDEAGWQFMR